jgi:hypothetical protein
MPRWHLATAQLQDAWPREQQRDAQPGAVQQPIHLHWNRVEGPALVCLVSELLPVGMYFAHSSGLMYAVYPILVAALRVSLPIEDLGAAADAAHSLRA